MAWVKGLPLEAVDTSEGRAEVRYPTENGDIHRCLCNKQWMMSRAENPVL